MSRAVTVNRKEAKAIRQLDDILSDKYLRGLDIQPPIVRDLLLKDIWATVRALRVRLDRARSYRSPKEKA